MSIQSQKKNMQVISNLIYKDLGYIYGNRENEPSGAKKEFLSKSATFLRAIGKDLHFTEMKVTTNSGGIAVSGDVSLYGMWGDGNGMFLQISQSAPNSQSFLYRHITGMKDYSGGHNQWIPYELFANRDYEKLIVILLKLKIRSEAVSSVA